MKSSNSEQNQINNHINKTNEQTKNTEEILTLNEQIFRENIEVIKSGSYTVRNTQEDALRQILRLLVNPANNQWNQLVQHLASELQLGNLMLSLLEMAQTDGAKTYCASILAVLGMLPIILDRAREAKRQGKEYGGSFMIFGEKEIEQEDKEIVLKRKVELLSNYQQQIENLENQQNKQIEIEHQRHNDGRNLSHNQIAELNQQILSQQNHIDNENELETQLNELRVNENEFNEKLINLNERVNQTDKLVDFKRNEVDGLEEQAKTKVDEVQKLKYVSQQQSIIKTNKKIIYQEPEDEEEMVYSGKDEKVKQKDKEKKKQKEKEKERLKEKQRKKEKEKENKKEREKEAKKEKGKEKDQLKEEYIEAQNDVDKKEQLEQQMKKKEKDEQIQKEQKVGQTDIPAPKIRTEIQIADFRGIISRTGAVMQTKRHGGIAIVSASEEIPKELSQEEMLNIRGVLFKVPEFALYQNGQQMWKRNLNVVAQQTQQLAQQSSSSSPQSTSQTSTQSANLTQQLPVWAHLCLQLDMVSEEKIAKFFIGPDLGESVSMGISGLPNQIKVVVLSSGALKAFQAFNTKRVGDDVTSLIPWEVQSEEK